MFQSFMDQAIEQALIAQSLNEVPVGAVITKDNMIIATGHNLTRTLNDPTAHAEIIAIREASQKLGNYRLNGCNLYVTLEPCAMCVGAISHARIDNLYFGASDEKGGAVVSGIQFFSQKTCLHKINIYEGIQEKESSALIKDFFRNKK